MNVSVIIPVFNADKLVDKAVTSALAQPETFEVILVEDGSKDNSLKVCTKLAHKYPLVKLLRHPEGKNKGASASRNLGMKNAKAEFISLLDADDYFLPNRFGHALEILNERPLCDGVYEAVGIEFENKDAKTSWQSSPMANVSTTTMSRIIDPDELLSSLLQGKYGRFHINGLLFRRSILEKSGLMNEKLGSMHEDTDFIYRLVIAGRLWPGNLEKPVAIRFVHRNNRISAQISKWRSFRYKLKMHMATYRWCKQNGFEKEKALLVNRMTIECNQAVFSEQPKSFFSFPIFRYLVWAFLYPEIFMEIQYWKAFISRVVKPFRLSD